MIENLLKHIGLTRFFEAGNNNHFEMVRQILLSKYVISVSNKKSDLCKSSEVHINTIAFYLEDETENILISLGNTPDEIANAKRIRSHWKNEFENLIDLRLSNNRINWELVYNMIHPYVSFNKVIRFSQFTNRILKLGSLSIFNLMLDIIIGKSSYNETVYILDHDIEPLINNHAIKNMYPMIYNRFKQIKV